MLNEKVCVGYVNNSYHRKGTVEKWQEIYEAMPIGVPLTATEIADRANKNRKGYPVYSHHNIPPMARAMGRRVIKREKIAIEPYEFEIECLDHWERTAYGCPHAVMVKKKIVVSEKTVYTRLV